MDDVFVGEARTAFQLLALLATVLSGFLLRRALRAHAWLKDLRRAVSPPLRDLPEAGTPVLVSGVAEAGSDGCLTAPYSGTRCVWYRVEVWERRPEPGTRYESPRLRMLSSEQSGVPFVLRDRTGAARCYPREVTMDRIALTHSSRVAAREERAPADAGTEADAETVPTALEHSYQEWSIAPGTPLVVHGTVYPWDGGVVIAASPEGRLLFSTRTAPQLRDAYRTMEFIGSAVFLLCSASLVWLILT
ncbi:GIDE domain-containing protein [Nocardiopsis lambiniae]|uniref:RING-type E3 ubiquitin transferase n=1 Tax=Nocardiopsis lambiniae TaxID=3075539 RepID=A0ABU2M7H5_9ACTN|nr:GIDE domain-containing protein [Nocardiopsis sp. DSM 44743]MDT0328613.1 GIDE domain-containing protein [Nocardiopsis sp. DSM 44743]